MFFFTSLLFMDTTLLLTSEQVSKWLHCGSFLCHHLDFSLWFPRLIYWSLLFFSFTWSFTGLEFINFEQIDVRRWVKDVASLIISFWGGLATLAMVLPWIAPGAGVCATSCSCAWSGDPGALASLPAELLGGAAARGLGLHHCWLWRPPQPAPNPSGSLCCRIHRPP